MLLGTILDLQLHTHADAVEEISDQSVKEEKMENTLAKLDELWSASSLNLLVYMGYMRDTPHLRRLQR